MKKIIYIATVGTRTEKDPKDSTKKIVSVNTDPLETGILNIKIQTLERVYLLTEHEPKSDFDEMFKKYPFLKAKTEFKSIKAFDYESLVEVLLSIHKIHQKDDFQTIVNITGGTKPMSLGAFMGAVLIGAEVHYTKEIKEGDEEAVISEIRMPQDPIYSMNAIQKIIIWVLQYYDETGGLNQSALRKTITSDYKGRKDLGFEVKSTISAQNISYHIDRLEENGIVHRYEDEANRRIQMVKLTRIGMMLANFISDSSKQVKKSSKNAKI